MKKKAVIILICAAAAAAALWAAREYLPGKERQSSGRREGAADAAAEDRETEYPEASVQEPESAGEPQATEEPAPEPFPVFESELISDEIFARMYGKSYKEDCTVPREELRYLRLSHYGFDGQIHEGEMVVNAAIADEVTEIFRELFEARYPIEKMRLIDDYDADDESSMADNNSSAFNYRTISGTDKLSNHSRGMAIDINPLYNPYIHSNTGTEACEPANALPYTDRSLDFPYKIDETDLCYQVFTAHGFSWGGSWSSAKDYQHFEYTE